MRHFGLATLLATWVCTLLLATGSTHAARLYWSDGSDQSIHSMNLDGSGVATVLPTGPAGLEGLAYDGAGDKIYWTIDSTINKVQRANPDGSGVETVLDIGDGPNAIAVDSAAGKMYLASEDTSSIQRANLGGPTSDVIVHTSPMQPGGIALDLLHGKVYWTKNDASSNISRANLDGTNPETFLSGPAAGQSFGSLFGIAVDTAAGNVYFSDESASRLYRSNLDGSNVVDITPASVNVLRPHGLALDLSAGQLYWGQNGAIGRLNLDLSAAKLFAVPSNPLNLAVVPEPSSAILAACGLATLLIVMRRRRPN